MAIEEFHAQHARCFATTCADRQLVTTREPSAAYALREPSGVLGA